MKIAVAAHIIPELRALGRQVFTVDTETGRFPPADMLRLPVVDWRARL